MEKTQRTVLKTLSSIFFIVILSFAITKPAHAGPFDWVSKQVFGGVAQSFGLDIRRTVTDTVVTAITELPNHILFGRSADQVQICSLQQTQIITGQNFPLPDEGEVEDNEDVITRQEVENADCSDMRLNLVAYDMGYTQQPPSSDRSGQGLLTGLHQAVGGSVYIEGVPASLAYYGKSMARKIPVVQNTAFAQASSPYSGEGVLWPAVLSVWEVSKNIAYGLLALFMLYIGIMIMMRKETDPRTTITVQTALPKIVIAVILITFSYAIGALGAEAIRGLNRLAYTPVEIVQRDFISQYDQEPLPGVIGAFTAVGALSVTTGGYIGTGLLSVILQIVIMLTLIFLTILIFFKILLAYFKIIIGIWTGPITFAWGAIPGNEDSTVNWFRNLAVNVISVPGMKLGIALSLWISYTMLTSIDPTSNVNLGDAVLGESGSVLAGVVIPAFIIVILFWTLKIPNLLEEAILNKKGNK